MEANLNIQTDANIPTTPAITKNSHPPSSALREFRAWIPVEFNKLWLSIICFLIELSFCITTSLGPGQGKVTWGLLVLLIGGVFYNLTTQEIEKLPLYGLFLLDAWFLYGLLPWGGSTFLLPGYLVALASPLLTLLYFLSGDGRVTGGYYFLQVLLLLYPVKLSAEIEPGEFWLQVLFFGTGWNTYLVVTSLLLGRVQPESAFMALVPLLRLQGALALLYIVVVECFLMFQLYMWWSQEGGLSFPSTSPLVVPDEETPAEEEVLLPSPEEEKEPVPPPPPPQQKTTKSRFKVTTLLQTHVPVAFSKTPQRTPTPQQQPINISPKAVIETEGLGGSKLKDVYGGGRT